MRKVTKNKKLCFIWGPTDHWGFAIGYYRYDRCLSIDFLRWYVGVEFWGSES